MIKRTERTPRRRDDGTGYGFAFKKSCKFCRGSTNKIDYKDVDTLSRHITEQGKILPSRISGNCAYHQRQMAKAIKRARTISILPFERE